MNVNEIRNKDTEALKVLLEDLREELFNLKNQNAIGHLADYTSIRKVKRDIARILTVLRERELGIEPKPKKKS